MSEEQKYNEILRQYKESRRTSKFNNANLTPEAPCRKCGLTQWADTEEFLTWKCVNCSNLAFYYYGSLKQQIEVIMEARGEDSEFVYSEDGQRIKTKKNEDIKRIKFNKKVKKWDT